MDPVQRHFDAAEMHARKVAQEFIVIARHIDDARALARPAQELLDNVVAALRPVPAALQAPAVDNVTDQNIGLGLVVAHEIDEKVGLGRLRAQMDVGNEDGAECPCLGFGAHRPSLSSLR